MLYVKWIRCNRWFFSLFLFLSLWEISWSCLASLLFFFSQVWTTHLLCSVSVKNRAYSAFSSLFDCQGKSKLTLDSELEQHLSKYRRLEDFRTEIVSIAGLMSCVPMDDFVKGGAGLGSCSFAGTFDVYGENRGLISQSSPQNCKIWGRRHLLRNHLFNALLLSTMTSSSAFLSGPVCLSSHSQPLILWMELSRKQKQRPLNFGYHTQCARGPRWSLCSMSSCWGSLGYYRQDPPPLEAILVIFGRSFLIFFFFWKVLDKYENDTTFVRMPSDDHLGDAKMSKKRHLASSNGGRAHYIIESNIQWKPLWLATQQYPQNDWLGGNFLYTMTYAHGPHLIFLRIAIDENGFRRMKEGRIYKRLPQNF